MKEMGTLDTLGFTAAQVRHFQALKQRYESGEFRADWTAKELGRLRYVRWLVTQGRLSG